MNVMGVDPGTTGAVAFITERGAAVYDLPVREIRGNGFSVRRIDGRALAKLIRSECPAGEPFAAFCESVHARAGERNSMMTQGSLMRSFGAIEAVCDCLGAPPELITPQAWQAFYGLVGKKTEIRGKGALPAATRKALELYPSVAGDLMRVKDHNRAESLLIAHFGMRKVLVQ